MHDQPLSSTIFPPKSQRAMEETATAIAAEEHRLRLELGEGRDGDGGLVPFFGGRRVRGGAEGTWVVSVFVVIHLVVFVATMFLNDCPSRSAGDCVAKSLGRFAFQPLRENPLLGPSASTLVKMGALRWSLISQQNQKWRLMTCPWLHAGIIHLIMNILSVIFIGIHLEQDFGPWRTGMIYLSSAFLGGVTSAIFVQHIPAVSSSGALFGLLGATLSGLVRNWQIYACKHRALAALAFVAMANFTLGLLPYVDNFSNIGGLLSGVLLGFMLLFNPQLSQLERKKGLFDIKSSVKLRHKLDKPAQRIIALIFFSTILAAGLFAVFCGANASEHCSWCHYLNCVPTKIWSCNEKATPCKAKVEDGGLTLTCKGTEEFRSYPFGNISRERMRDLCSLLCS